MGSGVSSVAMALLLWGVKKKKPNKPWSRLDSGGKWRAEGVAWRLWCHLDKGLNHPFPHLITGNKNNRGSTGLRWAQRDAMHGKQSAGPQQGCFPFITEVHPFLPTGALHRLSFWNSDCWFVSVIPLSGHVLLHCLRKTTQVWLGPKGILTDSGWPISAVVFRAHQSVASCLDAASGEQCQQGGPRPVISRLYQEGGIHCTVFWKEQICMSRCFTNKKVCLHLCGL